MVSLTIATTALNLNQEMTDFNYKKYSLENLENWMHDAMSAGEATPQEIYDTIRKVVEENYYIYKQKTSEAYELLALLNGNGKGHIKNYDDCVDKILSCDKDDKSPECKGAWNDFWESDSNIEYELREAEYYNKEVFVSEDGDLYPVKDKVVKWQLPVQVDGLTGDCYVQFPDDLLEAANLNEGDTVEWIDRGDGSFELKKVIKPLGMDEC
jgi:hypothetical protein